MHSEKKSTISSKAIGSGSGALKRGYTIQSVVRAASIIHAFQSTSEVLDLRVVAARVGLHKATTFRLLETLVEARLLERAGKQGYRCCVQAARSKRYRIGYASQSNLLPFTKTVSESMVVAANAANVDLLVLSNEFSPRVALQNAETFVSQKVDLVVGSQINVAVAAQIAAKFSDARIPFIALDIPHPGAIYFGADNYKAGRMAGRHLAKWAAKNWKSGPEQIILLGVDAAGPLLNARLTGVTDGIEELGQFGHSVPTHHYDTKGGQFEATLDIVRKHIRRRRPERALVGAVNDSTALAALQAFREAGLERACAIAGQDGSLAAREEMRRASTRLVCSVAYFPEMYGERVVQLALDLLKHKAVAPAVFVHHELVTPQNVDKVYPNDSWMKVHPHRV